ALLRRRFSNDGRRVRGTKASDLETLLRQLSDDSRISGVMERADGKEVRAGRLLCAERRDAVCHSGIPAIDDAQLDFFLQSLVFRTLLLHLERKLVQVPR